MLMKYCEYDEILEKTYNSYNNNKNIQINKSN